MKNVSKKHRKHDRYVFNFYSRKFKRMYGKSVLEYILNPKTFCSLETYVKEKRYEDEVQD